MVQLHMLLCDSLGNKWHTNKIIFILNASQMARLFRKTHIFSLRNIIKLIRNMENSKFWSMVNLLKILKAHAYNLWLLLKRIIPNKEKTFVNFQIVTTICVDYTNMHNFYCKEIYQQGMRSELKKMPNKQTNNK